MNGGWLTLVAEQHRPDQRRHLGRCRPARGTHPRLSGNSSEGEDPEEGSGQAGQFRTSCGSEVTALPPSAAGAGAAVPTGRRRSAKVPGRPVSRRRWGTARCSRRRPAPAPALRPELPGRDSNRCSQYTGRCPGPTGGPEERCGPRPTPPASWAGDSTSTQQRHPTGHGLRKQHRAGPGPQQRHRTSHGPRQQHRDARCPARRAALRAGRRRRGRGAPVARRMTGRSLFAGSAVLPSR